MIYEPIVNEEIEKLNNNTELSDEQRDARLKGTKQFFDSTIGSIIVGVVTPVLMGIITVLAVAVIFLIIGNIVFGGESNFKSMMSVAAWGFMIGIPETLIKIPLIISKGNLHVYSSLAVLFDKDQADTVLFKLADTVDLFVIWRIIVWSIGFAIMYKYTNNKSIAIMISLTVVYFTLKIGLGSLF